MQLPLFPLKTVLFPGALLPLHIFEPRYRQLLADLGTWDRRFGLLPPGEKEERPPPGTIGCAALVRAVLPLPEGLANIVVSGERRFRLVEAVSAATPYYQGQIEWVDDEPDVQVPTERELQHLRALGERYAVALHTLADRPAEVNLPEPTGQLTFEIAALLDWEFETRQRFLETRSATERVERLLHALPVLVTQAEARAQIHQAARSNGRGRVS
ncbi:MAG: LON peptidase substrate-binding domain-containing protein [Gemmatimonadales bacterium]